MSLGKVRQSILWNTDFYTKIDHDYGDDHDKFDSPIFDEPVASMIEDACDEMGSEYLARILKNKTLRYNLTKGTRSIE